MKLNLKEQIDRRLKEEGRKQQWVISKMNGMGNSLSDVTFSRKKNGVLDFSEKELEDLGSILNFEFKS